jgi:Rrf2 family protein
VLYRHNSELAIRAVLYLALQPPGKLSPIRQVAQGSNLPGPYLAKILRKLIRSGLVRAFRGPGGGVELGRAPEEITLWSVVRALDPDKQSATCVLGLRACSAESPCPLHQKWFPLRQQIQLLLEETTLAELARGLKRTLAPSADSRIGRRVPSAASVEARRRVNPGGTPGSRRANRIE